MVGSDRTYADESRVVPITRMRAAHRVDMLSLETATVQYSENVSHGDNNNKRWHRATVISKVCWPAWYRIDAVQYLSS